MSDAHVERRPVGCHVRDAAVPLPAVPGVLTGSRPSQRSARAPWAALAGSSSSLRLLCRPRRRWAQEAIVEEPPPASRVRWLLAPALPPPDTGSRKYLQVSVRQASRADSMIRPLRAHAVMLGLGRRNSRRQRCPRRGGSSCHRVWEAPCPPGGHCLMPPGHGALSPNSSPMPSEPRSSITSAAISVSPSPLLAVPHQGRGAVDSVLGSRVEGAPGCAGSQPARRVRQRPAVRRSDP